MIAEDIPATVNVEITRDKHGTPHASLVRRTRTRATRTPLTTLELANLAAEAGVALKIIEEHRA